MSRRQTPYPSQEVQYEKYRDLRDYLTRFPWEWMVTLTFEDGITFSHAQHMFKRWRLRLVDEEKIQVAGYMVSGTKKRLMHIHLLMFGRNREGKTLLDCSTRKWANRWKYFARIEEVYHDLGACGYVALHLLGFKSDHAEIDSFNRTLLSQSMRERRDGLDNFDGLMVVQDGSTNRADEIVL